MREHQAIDIRLAPLGPLAVMRPDDLRAVPQDVRHFISVLLLLRILSAVLRRDNLRAGAKAGAGALRIECVELSRTVLYGD